MINSFKNPAIMRILRTTERHGAGWREQNFIPTMKAFLDHLQTKGFRNRRIGLMENGSWAPAAARLMRAELEKMKELRLCETDVSLRGALNQTSEAQMDALVAELCAE